MMPHNDDDTVEFDTAAFLNSADAQAVMDRLMAPHIIDFTRAHETTCIRCGVVCHPPLGIDICVDCWVGEVDAMLAGMQSQPTAQEESEGE